MNRLDRIAQLESVQYTKQDLAEMVADLEAAAASKKQSMEGELAAKYDVIVLNNSNNPKESRLIYEGKKVSDIETIRLFIDPEYGTTLSVQQTDKVVSFLKGMPRRFHNNIHYRKLTAMDTYNREKILGEMTNKSLRQLIYQMLDAIVDLRLTVTKKSKQLDKMYRKGKQL
ncbi:hypothetical protein [Terribacillus sp. DMT04]|uniref:hypothetical protein n=1 Tax=Terribacillus sp. DMT04 TaxID=2850441 RepID=UPI001C2BFA1E|nr:hypothetical protein [Terribacillus sp. DMT04]QXE02806.1 hypothetical protein KS242_06400 [Terribacillus sp. DMT04]